MIPYLDIVVTRGDEDDSRKYTLQKSVAEITIVGNYMKPMFPCPSYNWVYHAEQELSEELFRDPELEQPGALHIMNSYPLMPGPPIMTHGVNLFHNAESFRCEICIAANPGIAMLASRAFKVVYCIKYKHYVSYASRHPQNPWPTDEQAGGEDPTSLPILGLEDSEGQQWSLESIHECIW